MDKAYPKLLFRDNKGRVVSVQIKSYTLANSNETRNLIHDLFDGEYEVVQCMIPKDYFR